MQAGAEVIAPGQQLTCKRCGDLGHFAKTCELPPCGRPDIERMVTDLHDNRSTKYYQRRTVEHVVGELVAYIRRLESSRREAIRELQRRMEAAA
jgi:hypothetical protein